MAKAIAMKLSSNTNVGTAEGWDGDTIVDGGLDELLGFQVRMAHVAIYRDFGASLAELDLTQSQSAILTLVGANAGVPQVAIAAWLGADRATIMAMVDKLEAQGLLRRERSKADRRRQELILTPLGKRTLTEAHARIAEHEARFTDLFTKVELRALFDALKRIQEAAAASA